MFKLNTISSLAVLLIGVFSPHIYEQKVSAANISQTSFNTKIITTGLRNPYAVAINNDDLIVTVNGSLLKIDPAGNITSIAALTSGSPADVIKLGSEFIVVENATSSLLRISESGIVNMLATNLGDPVGVAVQGSDFIVGDFGFGSGSLKRVSTDGQVSTIASTGIGGPTEVVVDGDNFWVTDFTFGRLLSVTANGNVTEIATGLGQPLDIVFDGKDFIITDFANGFDNPGQGRILRVSKSGEVETLLSGIGNPSGIAIDGLDLLFTDIVDGRVARVQGILAPQSVPEPSSNTGLIIVGAISGYILLKRQSQNNKAKVTAFSSNNSEYS